MFRAWMNGLMDSDEPLKKGMAGEARIGSLIVARGRRQRHVGGSWRSRGSPSADETSVRRSLRRRKEVRGGAASSRMNEVSD